MARSQKLLTYSHNFYSHAELPLDQIHAEKMLVEKPTPVLKMEDIQLFYFLRGSGVIQINGLEYTVRPGMVVRLFPFHLYSICAGQGEIMQIYRCCFPLSMMMYMDVKNRAEEPSITALETISPLIALDERDAGRVCDTMAELLEEEVNRDVSSNKMMLAGLIRVLAIYDRQAVRLMRQEAPQQRSLAWEALQYIHMHFNAPGIDASVVATELGTDPATLGHVLRMLTGQGFSDVLHEVRIRNACAMMRFDELTIVFIARYVGYRSQATFYRLFKQIKGVTPEQFRQGAVGTPAGACYPDTAWTILIYLLEHYAEDLSPADVAGQMFVSERTMGSILQDNFGMGFCALLERIRLGYACAMLGASELLICDIAIAVGFNSIRTFSRSFQRQMGTSPQQYRRHLLTMSFEGE